MKKFVLWMIRVFELDIPTEKIVTKVVEKQVLIPETELLKEITCQRSCYCKGIFGHRRESCSV